MLTLSRRLSGTRVTKLTHLKEGKRAVEPFVGEIRLFGFNFAPLGWAFCDGRLLPISQNTALFSLLGTTYGGDGRSTFALPDLRGPCAGLHGDERGCPRTRSASRQEQRTSP